MMDAIQKILMGMGCLALLWLGSCTILGVGSAVAIQRASSPENVERVEREADERENAKHNAQMNDEAAYGADRSNEVDPE